MPAQARPPLPFILAAVMPCGDVPPACLPACLPRPQVDEALKAENAFLEEADERAAYDRLRSLAEAHVDRWSQQPPHDSSASGGAAAEDGGGAAAAAAAAAAAGGKGGAGGAGGAGVARMALSLANQARASHGLQDKTMEALYIARYLVSRRNKLRVSGRCGAGAGAGAGRRGREQRLVVGLVFSAATNPPVVS